jgi:hypothetical protein
LRQIGAISSALSALTIVVGVLLYLIDFYSEPDLDISPPTVIELRCSALDFDPERCWAINDLGDSHFSVTAAFQIAVKGPARHTVSIDRAWADATLGETGTNVQLQAFWTTNLTPGNENQRRQIVPVSLTGGQAVSQEIWFTPVQRTCHQQSPATCGERRDFIPWHQFVYADLMKRLPKDSAQALGKEQRATLRFNFLWRRKGVTQSEPKIVPCTIEFGDTVARMIERDKPVRVTAPCIEARQNGNAQAQ